MNFLVYKYLYFIWRHNWIYLNILHCYIYNILQQNVIIIRTHVNYDLPTFSERIISFLLFKLRNNNYQRKFEWKWLIDYRRPKVNYFSEIPMILSSMVIYKQFWMKTQSIYPVILWIKALVKALAIELVEYHFQILCLWIFKHSREIAPRLRLIWFDWITSIYVK